MGWIDLSDTNTLRRDPLWWLPVKGGRYRGQLMLGVVQTAGGLPIHNQVFDSNVAETRTLLPTIETHALLHRREANLKPEQRGLFEAIGQPAPAASSL